MREERFPLLGLITNNKCQFPVVLICFAVVVSNVLKRTWHLLCLVSVHCIGLLSLPVSTPTSACWHQWAPHRSDAEDVGHGAWKVLVCPQNRSARAALQGPKLCHQQREWQSQLTCPPNSVMLWKLTVLEIWGVFLLEESVPEEDGHFFVLYFVQYTVANNNAAALPWWYERQIDRFQHAVHIKH